MLQILFKILIKNNSTLLVVHISYFPYVDDLLLSDFIVNIFSFQNFSACRHILYLLVIQLIRSHQIFTHCLYTQIHESQLFNHIFTIKIIFPLKIKQSINISRTGRIACILLGLGGTTTSDNTNQLSFTQWCCK